MRVRRIQVICPKCGEVNPNNFLFCGMCGTILEPVRKATVPISTPVASLSGVAENRPTETLSSGQPVTTAANAQHRVAVAHVPPIGGPSVLGLDEPIVEDLGQNRGHG